MQGLPGIQGQRGPKGSNDFGQILNGFFVLNYSNLNFKENEAKSNGKGTVYVDSDGNLKIVQN